MERFLDRKFLEEEKRELEEKKAKFKKRYKYVGEWVKLYSESSDPSTSYYEILVQNKEGEYTFKNRKSDGTNYEDETDFWFNNKKEALQTTTARQLTLDNLEARRYLSNAEYDKELERRMQINIKILKEATNEIDKNKRKDDLNQ